MTDLITESKRAWILATMMAVSVVAIGIGGVGTAAASPPDDPGGGDDGDVIVVEPGESIQEAEDNASAGDVIKVKEGVYNETVRVDTEDVTIEAYDPANPPTVRFEPDEPKHNATFEVIANDVRLSNLTIERVGHPDRTGENATAGVAIVPVDSDRPICTPCNDVTTGVVVEDSEIVGEFDLEDANGGVAITDGIRYNQLDIPGDAKNITIRDNEIHGFSGGTGLVAEYGGTITDVEIAGNHVHDNLATRNGTPQGTGVGFVRNTTDGYFENILVTGNNVSENHYGVRLAGNETDETLEDVDASAITVDHNDIVNNSEWGAMNNGTNVLDAENNWWGDADGPSGAGPGDGDAVSTGVDYDPWLEESTT